MRIGLRLAVSFLAFWPVRANAQAPEINGLTGGFALGAMRWQLSDTDARVDFIAGLSGGYRFQLGRLGSARVSVMPHVGLALTRFRGIALNSPEIAVSRKDLGVQLAARFGWARPYLLAQLGSVATERYVGPDLVNHSSGMPAFGAGIEIPRNNVCGAGFDIAARHTSGELTGGEWRQPGPVPPGGKFNAWIFTLGWSGRFRGTRLLFDCH